jgi:hypothetical protein
MWTKSNNCGIYGEHYFQALRPGHSGVVAAVAVPVIGVEQGAD